MSSVTKSRLSEGFDRTFVLERCSSVFERKIRFGGPKYFRITQFSNLQGAPTSFGLFERIRQIEGISAILN